MGPSKSWPPAGCEHVGFDPVKALEWLQPRPEEARGYKEMESRTMSEKVLPTGTHAERLDLVLAACFRLAWRDDEETRMSALLLFNAWAVCLPPVS